MDFKIPDTPEELLREGRKNFARLNQWTPLIIAVFAIGFIGLTSFYKIKPDSVGVIQRFGQYHRTTSPGLHWKFPFGVEKLTEVPVKKVIKQEFGFRTTQAGVRTQYSTKSFNSESLMLTGDLNVLDVKWIVQFKIKDPVQLLFNVREWIETIRDASEVVMRQKIGDSTVTEALTTRREIINMEAATKLQEILDSYNSGIQIENVKLQAVDPPDEVKASFNEENEAQQEKEKMINEARKAYNKVIPRARGEAQKVIQEAEAYRTKRVNEAKGDAAKFVATWNAYKEAKDVTRTRMYLETMQAVLPQVGKTYIMQTQSQSTLPLMNIGESFTHEAIK